MGGGGVNDRRWRWGSSEIIYTQHASLFFKCHEHALNSFWEPSVSTSRSFLWKQLSNKPSKLHSSGRLWLRLSDNKEIMELKLSSGSCVQRRGRDSEGFWSGQLGLCVVAVVVGGGPPVLLNISAILCIWKWVSSLKWRGGKGRDETALTAMGVCVGGWAGFFRILACAGWRGFSRTKAFAAEERSGFFLWAMLTAVSRTKAKSSKLWPTEIILLLHTLLKPHNDGHRFSNYPAPLSFSYYGLNWYNPVSHTHARTVFFFPSSSSLFSLPFS